MFGIHREALLKAKVGNLQHRLQVEAVTGTVYTLQGGFVLSGRSVSTGRRRKYSGRARHAGEGHG
eukprot:6027324-Amphidinium_carterae.1